MMRRLIKLLLLPAPDAVLVLEAAFWLLASSAVLRLVEFRKLAARLGQPMTDTPEELSPQMTGTAERIGWSLRMAAAGLPWTPTCLVLGIAGTRMLSRRGLPATLYLGVNRDSPETIEAHAWLRSGSVIVTGARLREKFTPVCAFSTTGGGNPNRTPRPWRPANPSDPASPPYPPEGSLP